METGLWSLHLLLFLALWCSAATALLSGFVLSTLQPKSGGGGRRRGGQRHKGKGQNSSTNPTAAPSSSGIGSCWKAHGSHFFLSLHQVSSFHTPWRKQMFGARHSPQSYYSSPFLVLLGFCFFVFFLHQVPYFLFNYFWKGTQRGMSHTKSIHLLSI